MNYIGILITFENRIRIVAFHRASSIFGSFHPILWLCVDANTAIIKEKFAEFRDSKMEFEITGICKITIFHCFKCVFFISYRDFWCAYFTTINGACQNIAPNYFYCNRSDFLCILNICAHLFIVISRRMEGTAIHFKSFQRKKLAVFVNVLLKWVRLLILDIDLILEFIVNGFLCLYAKSN